MEAGQEFGSYKLIARIGAGGMGEVGKAEDPRLRRTVAIKILPSASADSSESNARFMREARTAAQLYHPNIATIHSIEEHEGRAFIVMEYVEGEPLSAAIRSGRLGEAEVAYIGKGVAEALAEAHARGIVHRDVKPENVIVSGQRVKVLDFGIAKKYQTEKDAMDEGETFTDFRTQRGVILGTVQYMSPEQAMGKALDGRSDVFSLGVVLYEAATGRLPFKGETVTDTLTRIIRDDAPDLRASHPNLEPRLAAAIMKCLAKERDARFRSAAELAGELDEVFSNLRTGRKTAADQPTAVSVRPDEPGPVTTARHSAAKMAPAVGQRVHSPWPWIFGTVVVVALSVAATTWYLTKVLRPNESERAGVPDATATAMAEPVPGREAGRKDGRDIVAATSGEAAGSDDLDRDPAGIRGRPFDDLGVQDPGVGPPEPETGAAPDDAARALARRGFWLIGQGREGEGVEALRRAIEMDPTLARVWIPIGVASLRRGLEDDAKKAFAAALEQPVELGPRERDLAEFGLAVAEGDVDQMTNACRSAPFDREFAELRRLAREAGADCGPPGHGAEGPPRRGPGPPGGVKPRPNR